MTKQKFSSYKILRRHGGFYYCEHPEGGEIECKLKGSLKKGRRTTNLVVVGDHVKLDFFPDQKFKALLVEVCERKTVMRRAKGYKRGYGGRDEREAQALIANIDQVLLTMPVKEPDFHPLLLDRFLCIVEFMEITPIILLNKWDLLESSDFEYFEKIKLCYEKCGFKVVSLSLNSGLNMDEFKSILKGKTSFLMGPSGAGKSSLINSICPQLDIRLGEWSKRCKTGPQTTTVTQIYPIGEKTYIADTAGFSQVYLNHIFWEELRFCYPEYRKLSCKYQDCLHQSEDHCLVRQSVREGLLDAGRYDRYLKLLEECTKEQPWA